MGYFWRWILDSICLPDLLSAFTHHSFSYTLEYDTLSHYWYMLFNNSLQQIVTQKLCLRVCQSLTLYLGQICQSLSLNDEKAGILLLDWIWFLLWFSLEVLVKCLCLTAILYQRHWIKGVASFILLWNELGRDSPAEPSLNVCQWTHTYLDSKKHTLPWAPRNTHFPGLQALAVPIKT